MTVRYVVYDYLLLLTEDQQKAATAVVEAIEQERLELADATEAIRQTAAHFPKAVGEAMEHGIRET